MTDRSGARLWLRDKPAAAGLVPSLNGLRAFSIAIVFLSHNVSSSLFPGGFGVRVFFVISGFLITRLLFLEAETRGSISVPHFYLRRFLRLYPVILAYTVAMVVFCAMVTPDRLDVVEPMSALFYFANYHYAQVMGSGLDGDAGMPFAIFWSLSVEEHFYIFFPFLFLALRRRPARLALAACAILAICLLLRTGVALAHPELLRTYVFYFETQYQLDSISCGVLIAALCQYARGREIVAQAARPSVIAAALALLFIGFALRDTFFRETLRYSLMNIAIAVGICTIVFTDRLMPLKRLLNTPAADFVGRLSYSIYLWHVGSMYIVNWAGNEPRWKYLLPVLALTALLSCASYYLLERPLSSLRRQVGAAAPVVP